MGSGVQVAETNSKVKIVRFDLCFDLCLSCVVPCVVVRNLIVKIPCNAYIPRPYSLLPTPYKTIIDSLPIPLYYIV
jgi:hypothetical protein